MKRLLALAEQIKNKKLREKTIELLKKPEISNSELIYPKSDFTKAPSWIGAHHNYEGGLLDHTIGVVKASLALAEVFEELYKVKINKDHILAGAILHDIMKVFILSKHGKQWGMTGSLLDHAQFSASELYARDFPEEVIHIVAAHGGDMGSAGANPRTIEAMIVFYSDVLDSTIESNIHGVPAEQQLQMLLMAQAAKAAEEKDN